MKRPYLRFIAGLGALVAAGALSPAGAQPRSMDITGGKPAPQPPTQVYNDVEFEQSGYLPFTQAQLEIVSGILQVKVDQGLGGGANAHGCELYFKSEASGHPHTIDMNVNAFKREVALVSRGTNDDSYSRVTVDTERGTVTPPSGPASDANALALGRDAAQACLAIAGPPPTPEYRPYLRIEGTVITPPSPCCGNGVLELTSFTQGLLEHYVDKAQNVMLIIDGKEHKLEACPDINNLNISVASKGPLTTRYNMESSGVSIEEGLPFSRLQEAGCGTMHLNTHTEAAAAAANERVRPAPAPAPSIQMR